MTKPAIAADLHESLDIQVYLAAEIAFHREVAVDVVADTGDLVLGELLDARFRRDAYGS